MLSYVHSIWSLFSRSVGMPEKRWTVNDVAIVVRIYAFSSFGVIPIMSTSVCSNWHLHYEDGCYGMFQAERETKTWDTEWKISSTTAMIEVPYSFRHLMRVFFLFLRFVATQQFSEAFSVSIVWSHDYFWKKKNQMIQWTEYKRHPRVYTAST